jgi:hypothetical protein
MATSGAAGRRPATVACAAFRPKIRRAATERRRPRRGEFAPIAFHNKHEEDSCQYT